MKESMERVSHRNRTIFLSVVLVLVIGIIISICIFLRKVGKGADRNLPSEIEELEQEMLEETEVAESTLDERTPENSGTDTDLDGQNYDMQDFSWIYEEDGVLIDNQYLEETELKNVMTFLENLPDDREALVGEGGFIVSFQNVYGGGNLEAFCDFYEQGQQGTLLIGKYTDEGDLIFYDLIYDGEKLTLVVDTRRDKWARAQVFVSQHLYFSVLEQEKDGSLYKTLLLHNDPEMTVEKWINIDPMNPAAWEGLWNIADFTDTADVNRN